MEMIPEIDLTENKRIITETLGFINDSERFAWLESVMLVFGLCVFTIHCTYSICHLIGVHLYKFFTCLDPGV